MKSADPDTSDPVDDGMEQHDEGQASEQDVPAEQITPSTSRRRKTRWDEQTLHEAQ